MTDLFEKAMQESFDEGWSIFRLGEGYQVLVWDHLDEYLAFVDVRVLVGKKGRPRQRVAANQTLAE
jgi:hypothetical protein